MQKAYIHADISDEILSILRDHPDSMALDVFENSSLAENKSDVVLGLYNLVSDGVIVRDNNHRYRINNTSSEIHDSKQVLESGKYTSEERIDALNEVIGYFNSKNATETADILSDVLKTLQ